MEGDVAMIVSGIYVMLIIIPIFVFALIVKIYTNVWIPFINERNHIKMEMQRSTGKKKEYWKRRLNILYLLHIPIIGMFIINRKYKR